MPLTRTPTHGYAATREAAMAAFAKSWRREESVETSRPPRMVGRSPTECTEALLYGGDGGRSWRSSL
jgi:hypothetical protein